MDEKLIPPVPAHKLDLLGQTAIDYGIKFVEAHNRRVEEWEAAKRAAVSAGDGHGNR